ncbi:MAG: four helix bundle protein [Balneola sp.]|nr:MAG: four helix bundle protein [Balneola sp.]
MAFKFEKLEIWNLSKEMAKQVYMLIRLLPDEERYNLSSQMRRAVTSISLNIAEGSTSQTDPEQIRFLGYAHRSLMEVVACLILIKENNYIDKDFFEQLYRDAEKLSAKILAMRNSLKKNQNYYIKEDPKNYEVDI